MRVVFLLTGTLRVLRGKTSPRAEMLRGIKHRHVGPDFCKNADSSKGVMEPGTVSSSFNLREDSFEQSQNKGIRVLPYVFPENPCGHE